MAHRLTLEQAGFAAIIVGNAFAIWSALNPSPFTTKKFAQDASDRAELQKWQRRAALVIAVVTLGSLVVFRRIGKGG